MIEQIRQTGAHFVEGGQIDENTSWSLVETRYIDSNEVKSRYIHILERWEGNTGTWLYVNNVPEGVDYVAVANRAAAYLEKHPVSIEYEDVREA